MRRPIVLDTSFLISIAKYRLNLEAALAELVGEIELIVSERVIEELSAIASSRRRDARHAAAALGMLSKLRVRIVPTSQPVDPWILEHAARDPSASVATVDKELRRRLRDLKVRVLTIRGRKSIEFD